MSWFEENKDKYFRKYSDEELVQDIERFIHGKGQLSKVLEHFFSESIHKSITSRGTIAPYYALQNDDMINFILAYCKLKPTFYTGKTDIDNIKTYFRNAGGLCGISQKVANFSPVTARDIYFRYHDIHGERINILDTSCGFGARMSAAVLSGHNYCGFDHNKELMVKLKEYRQFLRDNWYLDDEQKCVLLCKGSEEYQEKLKGKFDVSFTSPPYFNIEKYSDDDCESTKNYDNYDLWLKRFVVPTIRNTYRYLKHGGYAMINIKNLTTKGKQKLFDDWCNIFLNSGKFRFVEVLEIAHQSKRNYSKNNASGYSPEQYRGFKEPVMVFQKNIKKYLILLLERIIIINERISP